MSAVRNPLASLDARRVMVFFLLVFPAVSGFRGLIDDPDIWWHLKEGEWILEHRSAVWRDVFSYTAEGQPWIGYSWLAEVLFHALVETFGLPSLIWLQTAVAVATVGFVYLATRASGARETAAVVVSALAALGMSFAWAIRPLVFTLLFLSMLVWGLHETRMERRLAWLVPVLTAVWANVHILFPAAVVITGFAAACRTIEGRPSRWLWIATGLSALATLATPYGIHLPGYVLVMARQPAIAPEVGEFQSPDFGGPQGLAFFAVLVPAVVILGLSRRTTGLFDAGTLLGSLALGLLSQRNMALFAILAAPVLAKHLEHLLPSVEVARRPSRGSAVFWNALLCAFGVALVAREVPAREAVVREGEFPVAAVEYLLEHHPRARLFNDFNWGGYLIYRMFPGTRVSMDGRTPVYEGVMRAYMKTHFLEPGWEEFLRRCDPDVVLWPTDGALTSVLREDASWKIVYEDPIAVVFQRKETVR